MRAQLRMMLRHRSEERLPQEIKAQERARKRPARARRKSRLIKMLLRRRKISLS